MYDCGKDKKYDDVLWEQEDLCLTCTTKKEECFFAQGIEIAIACVKYKDKRTASDCCKSEVVFHREEWVCGCCGMPHKKVS